MHLNRKKNLNNVFILPNFEHIIRYLPFFFYPGENKKMVYFYLFFISRS
jgi:hypothetical protein